ncbi:MAG: carbamoyltransferase C-terminal domain-containing protein [Gammaproteobacteria bacterium]
MGAFQYTTWEKDALFISSDGGDDGATYSAYAFDGKTLKCIYGSDIFITREHQKTAASVGIAYQIVTKQLGFRANRHEGKITGLAAYGRPVFGEEMAGVFMVNNDGSIDSRFNRTEEDKKYLFDISRGLSGEDIASSIQYATEKVILNWVNKLLEIFPARYIGMSGGVFSNVRLNQKISELPGIEEIYIFPPMGDEGLPLGNCANAHIEKYGLQALPRQHLANVYYGRRYTPQDVIRQAYKKGFLVKEGCDVPEMSAFLLANNKVGAIYSQSMEMGPRALGARSILANPKESSINKILNERLERTEFMPFAPYVLAEDAEEVFRISHKNREACRFMTITTDVHQKYHDLIPAVVHVDGTARPQIIERDTNPLYYEILEEFKSLTGIPCLVNTSFNAHEEPIINTPGEALRALQENRIDFLIAETGIIFLNERGAAPVLEDVKK